MRKVFLPGFFALAFAATLFSCKKSHPIPEKTQIITLPSGGSAVIDANNRLAFNFLQATLQQDAAVNNRLISPLSIYLALSMVYNGADRDTKDSMAKALQIQGLDINTLNAACHSLITQLPTEDNKVQLSIANSIWYRQNSFQPLAPFLDTTQNDYDATVRGLNFDDPGAVKTINDWVAQKTNNKIPTILNSIPKDDLMYLIDAIYFNGPWQIAFDPSATHSDVFHLQNGNTVSVPFMAREAKVKRYADNSFTLVELPYGGGSSYSMFIALPKDGQPPVNTLSATINADWLTNAISKMDSVTVALEIPKWEYSYAIDDMKPELSQLGMGIAFTDQADFSKMYDPGQVKIKISKAIHKTYVKVDEEGTQAAAVTAIGVAELTMVPAIQFFRVDHPFIYAIVEKQTGAVLFLGVVNDPSAN
jgi:serine protease inhibitor